MYDTFLTIVCGLNAYLSRNIFHVHINIMICISRILQQQKRTFEQIYSNFSETRHLPTFSPRGGTFQPHLSSVPTDIRTNDCHTWLLASTKHRNRTQNNVNIHGIPVKVQWKPGKKDLWRHKCLRRSYL